ncbi:PAS domain-containing protein [Sorangium sp. So ce1036]|uniref:PAS domain-containing sensor histidine kinase n=1 Tax=Sorangium sp. So ce1036 TaxID=3133328 RepID=UPI003F085C5D
MSIALSRAAEPAAARHVIVQTALRHLHAAVVNLYEIRQEPLALELVMEGRGSLFRDPLEPLPFDAQRLAAEAARTGLAQIAPDDGRGAPLPGVIAADGHGDAIATALPLAFAGEVRAVLFYAASRVAFTKADATGIARALSSVFGMALAAVESRALRARVEELEREKLELQRTSERLSAAIDEARATEAALRLSEESLARAQKIARLGNWDWHIPQNRLFWSDECYPMLGLARGDGALTYEKFLARIHPEDRDRVMRSVELALQGAAPYCLEYRILRPDGEERILQTEADVIRDGDGTPLRLIGTALDVTEPRRAATALRLSEERLRVIAEHASDVIFRRRLGPERTYEYINPAVLELTGYPPEAWYDNPRLFEELLHPEDRERYDAFVERMATGGGRITLRIIDRGGRVRWFANHIAIQRDGSGNPITCVGISRDVTTEKLADEERERLVRQLAAERSWLIAVIERSPVGILLLDAAGAQIALNRRAKELGGTASPGSTDASLLCFPDGQPLPDEEQPAARALRGEVTTARALSLRRPDGGAVAVLVSAGPIVDGTGKLLGAVVVFDDITRLKDLERLKEEWTSVVAHDLKQPVTTIIGYAAQLERRPQMAAAVKIRAGHILASARRLGRMISDLTDISRIESRRLAIESDPVDLAALVEAVVERTAGETEGHEVHVELTGEIPIVQADAGRVEQVLSNLLSNAAKYGDPGTPIQVTLARRGGEVQVSIQNTGRGIPPEDLPLLFERFFRGRAMRNERVVGLGLGLYIAKGLIEAHRGRIWVESPRGGRTTFHFTLPIGLPPPRSGA